MLHNLFQIFSVFILGIIVIYTFSTKRSSENKILDIISFLSLFLMIYVATNNSLFLLFIVIEVIYLLKTIK